MSDINHVTLVGRLGFDPELRHTQGGQAVCRLRVATSRRWHDKAAGSMKEETEWHRVTVWGKRGENCNEYLSKGREVAVMGRLRTTKYTDKSGVEKYSTEIVATDVSFLGSGGKAGGGPQSPTFSGDDDIPF